MRPLTPIFVRFHPGNTPSTAHFSLALQVNNTLTSVNFERNQIGPEGATAFAEALKVR